MELKHFCIFFVKIFSADSWQPLKKVAFSRHINYKDTNQIKLSGDIQMLIDSIPNGYHWSWAFDSWSGTSAFTIIDAEQTETSAGVITIKNNNILNNTIIFSIPNNYTEEECIELFNTDDNGIYCPLNPTIGNQIVKCTYGSFSSGCSTRALGRQTHAEGRDTIADVRYAHAEGSHTYAGGMASHAEGFGHSTTNKNLAMGTASHTEGVNTQALNYATHAAGTCAIAKDEYSYVWSGQFNLNNCISSHGSGTFTINPINGINGFYIGNTNLCSIISAEVKRQIDLLTSK